MVYSYAELKGKIKKGDKVRAVPGKYNPCSQLNNDGSNTQSITEVDDYHLYISACGHGYRDDAYLEIVNEPKTLETLEVGDVVESGGCQRKVLAVLALGVYLLSSANNFDLAGPIFTVYELKETGYTVVNEQTESVTEMTVSEISKALGKTVKVIEG